MNNVEKPMKPKWFAIVEILLSLFLLLAIVAAWTGLTSVLKVLGIPPMWAMILSATLLVLLVRGVMLPKMGSCHEG